MPDLIDLRSDTVTRPSPAMRRAMALAEVGDDVFGDDPTVIALQERAAELTGKPAALFVASGTMGNLVSHVAHVPRGGEIIAESGTHLFQMEAGGYAVITGATVRTVSAGPDGTMDLGEVRAAFRPDDAHQPQTTLVTLENTHASSMGRPISAAYTAELAAVAHDHGVPLHVDGRPPLQQRRRPGHHGPDPAGSRGQRHLLPLQGPRLPVGSVVVGEPDFIARAHRARKLVGGGMRQAGILAAAGWWP